MNYLLCGRFYNKEKSPAQQHFFAENYFIKILSYSVSKPNLHVTFQPSSSSAPK